jgi:hypothetical protein
MKQMKVTFNVPDFYTMKDLIVSLEEGLKETVAIVEHNPEGKELKILTAEMEISGYDVSLQTIRLREVTKSMSNTKKLLERIDLYYDQMKRMELAERRTSSEDKTPLILLKNRSIDIEDLEAFKFTSLQVCGHDETGMALEKLNALAFSGRKYGLSININTDTENDFLQKKAK